MEPNANTAGLTLNQPANDKAGLRIPLIELFLVGGFFVFSCDVIDKFLRPSGMDNAVYFAIYGLAAVFLILFGYVFPILRRAPLLVLLISLPLLSAFWSIDPRMTVARGLELFGSSLFALFAGWHLTIDRMLQRLAIGFGLMCFGSLLTIFLLPSLGIAQDEAWGGTWIGLSLHKNGLGGTTSLAVLVLFYTFTVTRHFWAVGLMLLMAIILLVGSKSATAQLVTLISLALASGIAVYQYHLRMGMLLAAIAFFLVPISIWAFVAFDIGPMIVSMIGKDTTLGSRIGIWQLVWPYIEDRWWLGFGYGAFWQPDLPWVDQVTARLNFTPYYSHNGVVELWLGGGVILVSLTALVYVLSLAKSLVPVVRERHNWYHGFALVFMVTFVFRNMTEAAALTRNDMAWVLFVAVAASLARDVSFRMSSKTP